MSDGTEFFNEKHGDDVVLPDLNAVPRFLLVEVLADPEEEEQELRLTINGLNGDAVHELITNLFFSINGR